MAPKKDLKISRPWLASMDEYPIRDPEAEPGFPTLGQPGRPMSENELRSELQDARVISARDLAKRSTAEGT